MRDITKLIGAATFGAMLATSISLWAQPSSSGCQQAAAKMQALLAMQTDAIVETRSDIDVIKRKQDLIAEMFRQWNDALPAIAHCKTSCRNTR